MEVTHTEWRLVDGQLISLEMNADGVAVGGFASDEVRVVATEYGIQFEVDGASDVVVLLLELEGGFFSCL